MTLGAWGIMALRGEGTLSAAGFSNLKYFTVLSNIFNGAVSLFYAIRLASVLRHQSRRLSFRLHLLKYIATAAVALTFLVVTGFFGPLYGWASMYQGANLWFHLILPLVSLLEFCFVDNFFPLAFRASFLTMIPPLLYGFAYLTNLLINGVGIWPDTNDWYGFVNWGLPVGIGIFAAIVLATWGLALLLRAVNLTIWKRQNRTQVGNKGTTSRPPFRTAPAYAAGP